MLSAFKKEISERKALRKAQTEAFLAQNKFLFPNETWVRIKTFIMNEVRMVSCEWTRNLMKK